MFARTLSVLALLCLATPLWAQPGQDPPAGRLQQVEAIQESYRNSIIEARAKLAEATPEERQQILQAVFAEHAKLAQQAKELAAANPSDAAGLEALQFSFALDQSDEEVIGMLAKHHAGSEEITNVVRSVSMSPKPFHKALFNQVRESNNNREAKAWATFGLANLLASESKTADDEAGQAAIEAYGEVVDEYGSILVRQGMTLADLAKGAKFEFENLAIGRKAPDAVSKNLEGNEVRLSDHRGKVVILNFWATWCGPCRAMLPHERELYEKHADDPFVMISISADDDKQEVIEFQKNEPMPWTNWYEGPGGELMTQWNIRYFPTIYVIDSNGVIRYKDVRGEALDQAVATLLAEKNKS
jgi:thiol-disulfide isomerase/thioredoxin